jgi:uncharacterized protein
MAHIDPKKRQVVADIIRRLHDGLDPEEAKSEILRSVGKLSSAEITEIEQGLVNDGISPDEIRRFCNVHARLFESALEQAVSSPDSPSHPVNLLRRENREIEKVVSGLRENIARGEPVESGLERLRGVIGHYELKENAIFPYLEKAGFTGPSKVMWSKHNEIRDMIRKASTPGMRTPELLTLLLDEVEGMIFKEENILYPASLERISAGEWMQVFTSCEEIGFPFLKGAGLHSTLVDAESRMEGAAPSAQAAGEIAMPTGSLSITELTALLNVLPVDITFVDAQDRVKYFSQSRDRIFVRATSVLGRNVQNCHPPQSLKKVVEIVESFRNGSRDSAEFWIQLKGQFVHIRYFAVRDPEGVYLGTLEVTQDLSPLRALTGEKRLPSGAN